MEIEGEALDQIPIGKRDKERERGSERERGGGERERVRGSERERERKESINIATN